MKPWPFLRDKFLLLLLHLVCMGLLSAFLRLTGYGGEKALLLLIFWFLILAAWLAVTYLQRKKYFDEAEKILSGMEEKYLLGELLPPSFRLEDKLYRQMLHRSNKSVIERIRALEDEKREYKEFIESWVHEIKAPITGIALLCENGRKRTEPVPAKGNECGTVNPSSNRELLRDVTLENQKIENLVEQVLYYARMEKVYQDFLIRETNLQEIAQEVLRKNRLLLIGKKVRAEVACPHRVYTDGKWIAFILNQMMLNSVKYCCEQPEFLITTKPSEKGVLLIFEDNGRGIPEEDLPRIFDKGFTGSNGRAKEGAVEIGTARVETAGMEATGMGLYLCRRLCEKLGVGLWAESAPGCGTRMIMEFPVSRYIIREGTEKHGR